MSGLAQSPAQETKTLESWKWEEFTQNDGLPLGAVQSFYQSADKTLWAITEKGVCWFDRYSWHPIWMVESYHPNIRNLRMDENPDGLLYLLFNDSLFTINRQGYKAVSIPAGWNLLRDFVIQENKLILLTLPDSTGKCKVGWLDNNKVSEIPVSDISQGSDYWELIKGKKHIFLAQRNRLFLLNYERKFVPVSLNIKPDNTILGVTENEDGTGLVIFHSADDTYKFVSFNWNKPEITKIKTVQTTFLFRSFSMIDNETGYLLNNTGQLQLYTQNHLIDLQVPANLGNKNCVLVDSEKNLWVGSFGKIYLYQTSKKLWDVIPTGTTNADNYINEIFIDRDKSIWAATLSGIFCKKKDGTTTLTRTINGEPIQKITSINQDENGNIWIGSGSIRNSTYVYNGKRWKKTGKKEGFTDECVHQILKAPDGSLIFLVFVNSLNTSNRGGQGYFIYKNGKFNYPEINTRLPGSRFYSAQSQKDGTLWLAGIGGAIRIKNNSFNFYTLIDSMPIGRVTDLYINGQDEVYAFITPKGLAKFNGNRFNSLNLPANYDPKRSTARITGDSNGIIWHTGSEGLYSYYKDELYHISLKAGLKTQTTYPVLTQGNKVYIGTAGEGIQVLDLSYFKKNLIRLRTESPILQNNNAIIHWKVESESKFFPEDFEVSFRIDQNAEWSAWQQNKELTIPNLSSGKHLILLRVKGIFPVSKMPELAIPVSVPYPYYLQPYFYLPVCLLLIASVYFIYYSNFNRKKTINQLQAKEQKLKSYLGSMPFTSMLLTRYGVCAEVFNAKGSKTVQLYELEEATNLLRILPPEKYQEYEKKFDECHQTGKSQIIEFESPTHKGCFYELLLSAYETESYIEKYCIGVLIDETEKKQIEAEIIAAKSIAEKANETKMNFLSSMSHEIRTPMNAISGITEILIEEEDDEETLENLKIIRQSVETLLVIVNDILDFSKIEAGKIELEKIPLRLDHIIEHLYKMFDRKATEKAIRFRYQIDPNTPLELTGDPTRLIQILLNLTGNAFKFTPEGYIHIRVWPEEVTDSKAKLIFSVKDSGIGIAPENQKRIFELFDQGGRQTARKYGGTGLGLTITKHLVELQGGKIQVISSPNIGSEFRVELTFDLSAKPTRIPVQTAVSKGIGGLKILVVEDNPINQKVVQQILTKKGAEVVLANNGLEALQILDKSEFNLILMDLQMPVMDGFEATQRIRKMEGLKANIPIIALTADAYAEIRQKALESGMDDYISKPFKNEELQLKIERLVFNDK